MKDKKYTQRMLCETHSILQVGGYMVAIKNGRITHACSGTGSGLHCHLQEIEAHDEFYHELNKQVPDLYKFDFINR